MNPYTVPPIVAGVAAVVVSVSRRISTILVEVSGTVPSPRELSTVLLGGRLLAFVAVYGLLFGVAYWAGTRRDDPDADGRLALASGGVAALVYALTTGALVFAIEVEQSLLATIAMVLGSGVGVGVQLTVVAFAAVALAQR